MTDFTQIRLDIDGPIATITLDRPEKMNAYTRTMMGEIIEAMDALDDDDDVRAIIFTGSGDRAFCAGADLRPEGGGHVFSDPEQVDDVSDERVRDGGGRLTLRLFGSTKPLIGACNGVAVGVGATMQLPFDMRLASENARFGFV
ncbi:MAG: enoyl-CoA hydratase-related protein, partial [Parvularcula sp.]|nr:enoyl-CoA hydratase-related protein [Parvularcula sp.]